MSNQNQKKFLDLGGHTVEILARIEDDHWAGLAFVHGTKTSVRGAILDLGSCRNSFIRSLAAAIVDPVDSEEYDETCAAIEDILCGMMGE
jgi:hypothetical protein